MKILDIFNSDNGDGNNLYPEVIFENVTDRLNDMRDEDCHKGTFGTLACICGSYGMAGAAMLCGTAAVTCGAGIVKMVLPRSIYPIAASNLWEAVYVPMNESDEGTLLFSDVQKLLDISEKCTAVVIGCGLRVNENTEKIVCELLSRCTKPIILDADGLNCISSHINVLRQRAYPTILTPHPGEMSRLCNMSIADIQHNREKIAADFANQTGCITVLKGNETVITDGDRTVVNPTGNGCLAKGGSGDVLAGVIGAFVCQGIEPFEAAAAGAYLHGYAADECIDEYSLPCVTARDVINAIKYLM